MNNNKIRKSNKKKNKNQKDNLPRIQFRKKYKRKQKTRKNRFLTINSSY